MTRKRRTPLQRAAIFDAHNGVCHICGDKIDGTREAWELEHVIPYEMTRDDSDANLRPAHVSCHKGKTAQDKKNLAKSKRVAAKHKGAWRPKSTLAGSKQSRWKRKLDGTVVPRDD